MVKRYNMTWIFPKTALKTHYQLTNKKMKKTIKVEDVRKLTDDLVFNVFEATRFVQNGSGKKHAGVFDILNPLLDKHLVDFINGTRKLAGIIK